jgi:hypothetical protein
MDRSELSLVWASIEADLRRARSLLGEGSSNDSILRLFDEFLEHNELQLACDALSDYGEKHAAPGSFWLHSVMQPTKCSYPERPMSTKDILSKLGAPL